MSYERITIDHRKMGGLPCIRGLRIPVSSVIGQLAAGRTHEDILADFPDLEEADIVAALEYAAAAIQERELPLGGGVKLLLDANLSPRLAALLNKQGNDSVHVREHGLQRG